MFKKLHKKDVLVKYSETKEAKSESGIVLNTARSAIDDRQLKGVVVNIGNKVKHIKIGDVVVWDLQSGYDFPIKDGEKFTLLSEDKILGIIEE